MNDLAPASPLCEKTASIAPLELATFHSINLAKADLSHAHPGELLLEKAAAVGAALINGQIFGRTDTPEARPFGVASLAGIHSPASRVFGARALAVAAPHIAPIHHRGRQVGWSFQDDVAQYGFFPELPPPGNFHLPPGAQAAEWFQSLDEILGCGGFSFDDVIRTWFYLDHILDWYDDFNHARNAFFRRRGVFEKFVPASTGVGAANPWGAALCGSLLCFRPHDDRAGVKIVASPLQCPAIDYRSSFSRAIEVRLPGKRWLMVSGTASIALDGKSAHEGNPDAQVRLTMDVLSSILSSRGLSWDAVWRGIAYFKEPSVAAAFDRWLEAFHPAGLPLTRAVCEICREELLFEVELEVFADTSA